MSQLQQHFGEHEPARTMSCECPPRRLPAFVARGQRARDIRHWTPRVDVAAEAVDALAEALDAFIGSN